MTDSLSGDFLMQLPAPVRAALVALTMAVTGTGFVTGANADGGSIRFNVIKAGFVIGGSAGSGTLVFHGQRYRLSIGGINIRFTFGRPAPHFRGSDHQLSKTSPCEWVF